MTTRSLPVCLARTLGLIAGQIPGLTGVWSNLTSSRAAPAARRPPAKVNAHGVTQRGFTLNVDPDMT